MASKDLYTALSHPPVRAIIMLPLTVTCEVLHNVDTVVNVL